MKESVCCFKMISSFASAKFSPLPNQGKKQPPMTRCQKMPGSFYVFGLKPPNSAYVQENRF